MAKRFTCSDKWDDPWFSELSKEHKLLWIYILDKCDFIGIYKVNKRMVEFCIDHKFDWGDVDRVLTGRVHSVNKAKWFIPKFIEFQYGSLSETNRVHNKVINLLKKDGLYKLCGRPVHRAKDQDQDKDMDKDKKKDIDFLTEIRDLPAYKGIDIDNELSKMDAWLLLNPRRQKTKRFVLNWLNKADKPLPKEKKGNDLGPKYKGARHTS